MNGSPYGGLKLVANTAALALTTTPTLLDAFSGAFGANAQNSFGTDGDPAVQPDQANNRILVESPGIYAVDISLSGFGDGAADIVMQIRKNKIAVPELKNTGAAPMSPYVLSASLSPASVTSSSAVEQTIAFAGTLTTDVVLNIIKPTAQAGLGIGGVRIPSAGNVAINFINDTGAPIAPTGTETYQLSVLRAGRAALSVRSYINVAKTDSPGNIANFPDPTGPFGGKSGSLFTMVPIDVTLAVLAGSGINFTPEYVTFNIERVG